VVGEGVEWRGEGVIMSF